MRDVRVNQRARKRLEAGHVWVYAGELDEAVQQVAEKTVQLRDATGRLLGSALLDRGGAVEARVYSRKAEPFDGVLLRRRLEQAAEWRERALERETTSYRLVFSEADGLPGLTVDRYDAAFFIQARLGVYVEEMSVILTFLQERFGAQKVILEDGAGARSVVEGEGGLAEYHLNGLQLEADLLTGQKTGTFLDQRENYRKVSEWVRRAGPRVSGSFRALDLFCNTGGFALHLAREGGEVEAVDRSREALAAVSANAARNGIAKVRPIASEVKNYFQAGLQARRRFAAVVVDPPAFVKSRQKLSEGMQGYFAVNLGALRLVDRGGIFATFSCSQAVSEEGLLEVVREAAGETRKELTVLEKLSQSIDHRQLLQVPETSYLKGFVFRVGDEK